MQLGPTRRRPAAFAVSSKLACVSRPAASTSPKPEESTTATRARRPASARIAPGTAAAGKLTSARSMPSGRASIDDTLAKPRIASPDGFTGYTVPRKPDSFRFWSSRWPSFAGLRETPRTATARGEKTGSRVAITRAGGASPAISPLASCRRPALGSQIHHANRLALGALDLAEPAELEVGTEAQEIVELAAHPRGHDRVTARLGLDHHGHALATAVGVQHDLVLVAEPGLAQQHLLDLARVEVHPLEDDHVVGAAAQAIEAQHRPAAVARGARDDAREVVRAISHERQSLTGERRDHQLTLDAVGQDTARGRVHDLDMIMILPDVDAGAGRAVDAEAGAARLRHPDDVEGADGELPLDPSPQLIGPHLGAEDPDAQRERAEVEPLFAGDFEQPQRVRRDGGEHGRAQVTHQLELEQRAAGADGHDHRAQSLGAVMEAEATGEQPERRRDLDDVARRHTGGDAAARHHLAPLLDVGRRVGIENRVAGGAARHLDAPVVATAGQTERIGVAQLLLGQEGQPPPVLDVREILRAHAAEALDPGRVLAHAGDRGPHVLERQPLEPLAQPAMGPLDPVAVGHDAVAAQPHAQQALPSQRGDVEMVAEDRDARRPPRVASRFDQRVHEARITALAVDLRPAVILSRLDEVDLVVATWKSR